MPKAVSRKAGAQTARSAPYPPPSASTSNPDTNSSSGPLIARSTNVPPKKASASTKPTTTPGPATAPAPGSSSSSFLDLTLPGEDSASVPVYDSCAQIRAKIKNLLEKHKDRPENAQPGVFDKSGRAKPWTAKAFCDAVGVSASSYGHFMKKSGHMGGAENHTYYGAYVFFEKKRIFEGAKKSAARVKIEQEWPRGLELKDPKSISVWVRKGEDPRAFIPKLYGGTAPASVWSKR